MASKSPRQHGGGRMEPEQAPPPEPGHAERARTLVHLGRVGSLSTISRKHPGWPFGSVMPYGLDEEGSPCFLISTMAMHTQNLTDEPRASLLVTQPESDEDPLGAGRVTLMGRATMVPEAQLKSIRERYLARYENASYWVDFDDFAFYRMMIEDLYFVGGFGAMGWVSAADYSAAEIDPLADQGPSILQHMNTDHAEAGLLLAKVFAGIEASEARMTAIDRLGFQLRLATGEGMKSVRIPFENEVRSSEQSRTALVAMVHEARRQEEAP
jgi:hypothetical protein